MSNIGNTNSADPFRAVRVNVTDDKISSGASARSAPSQMQCGLGAVPVVADVGQAQRKQVAESSSASALSTGEAITSSIVHVSPPDVRTGEALQDLEHENQIAAQAVENLKLVIKTSKTMACLDALKFNEVPMSDIASAFAAANQGAAWSTKPLILNNGKTPVRLIIPASGEQSQYTVFTPTIIPAGVKTTINGVTTTAPNRVPTTEENQQIHGLINEALQVYYQDNVSRLFSGTHRAGAPIMASSISEFFNTIEEAEGDNEIKHQNGMIAPQHSQIPAPLIAALADHRALNTSDERERAITNTLSEKANASLTSPNAALGQAALHAGSAAARGVGVVVGTIAGVGPKAVGAAGVGAGVGISTAMGIGIPVNLGATATAVGLGAAMGSSWNLDVSEMGSAMLGGNLGTVMGMIVGSILAPHAVVASIIGGAVIGGAAPLVYNAAPDAAERAGNYFDPGTALAKAKEELMNFSGDGAKSVLALMQKAQETDLEAMVTLSDLFASFAPVKNSGGVDQAPRNASSLSAASSSRAIAVEGTKTDKGASSTPPILTPERVQAVLIDQIKKRMQYREDLITQLQKTIVVIKEENRLAEKKANSPAFRNRYYRRGL